MKNEERDIYTIPPNFIEGGTLLGGMFRTRNVVEAGILAVAIGGPVLSLHFSLTVRIIILCLTALPLALVALIGINGSSLSSFFIQLLSFLRNRRVLSADEPADTPKKKPILPSWARRKPPKPAAEDEQERPKSRNRLHVDWKERKVTQVKTFLEEEPLQKPLNPIAGYVPIEKIENGIIYTRDHRYIKVVEVVPVNFMLRSAQEQRGIIYSFISYLKIAPAKVQFKVLTKRADINRHLQMVKKELEQETDPHCRVLQEDYLQLIRQLGSREAVTRRFFLIFEYEEMPGTRRGHEEEEAISSLQTAARTAANYLRQCGNTVLMPDDEDEATSEILYSILCRRQSNTQPFQARVKQVLSDYIASGRSLDAIPSNEFYAPRRIDFSHSRYLEVDGLYYAYLLVPSAGYKPQVPAGWLSLLVNAGDGIDLDMFLAKQPKDRMVRKLGQQLRINRSRIKEASDTNTDFDDLDGAIRSGYFLKDGLANNEDFYYITADDLPDGANTSGRFYLRELEAAEGYILDEEYKTVYVRPGHTAEIEWVNEAITGQIQIYKYAAEYNEVTGTPAGTPLQGAVYEIIHARSGKVVDYITTDARGVAASKPLPLTRYKVVEVTAPAYWQVDPTVHDITLEYAGQIIKVSAYDKPSNLGVTITKRGNAEVLAGQTMRYDLTVANTSNVPLENFYWHDKIPYDVARATTLTTGTYSARLNYRILYKTNYQTTYQVLASNLLTSNNYSFALNAIPMQAGEVVTDIYFDFGKVPVGFRSTAGPTLSVIVNGNTVNGYQLVNRADAGGQYQGTWQTAQASWVTIVRKYTTTPDLPKTGY